MATWIGENTEEGAMAGFAGRMKDCQVRWVHEHGHSTAMYGKGDVVYANFMMDDEGAVGTSSMLSLCHTILGNTLLS